MHFARLKLDYISPQNALYIDKELAGSPAMVGVDNSGRFFFSQTAAVGFVLQGKGIKIILENLKTFLGYVRWDLFRLAPAIYTSGRRSQLVLRDRLLQRAVHPGFT